MVGTIRDDDPGVALDALVDQLLEELGGTLEYPLKDIKPAVVNPAVTTRSVDTASSISSILNAPKNDPTKSDLLLPLGLATFKYFHNLTVPDKRQESGVAEWKEWKEKWYNEPDVEEWNMKELAGILNKIFHLDALRHPIDFMWIHNLVTASKVYGDCQHTKDDMLRIRMDPKDYHVRKGLPSHQESLLSTFTHELLHGYFQSLCCDGADKHSPKGDGACVRNGVRLWPDSEGDGHFFGWFLVACHIDLRASDLLGGEWKLFSFRSLISDCRAGGTVSAEDWKLFFDLFKLEEVKQLFGHLNDHKDYLERDDLLDLLKEDDEVMEVWIVAFS